MLHGIMIIQFEKELCLKNPLDNLTSNLPLVIKTKQKNSKAPENNLKPQISFTISHLSKQDTSIPTDEQVQIQR